jgi:cob(I)alamin adenosyltransferase
MVNAPMKIYTKTGDKGGTRLFDGSQVRKNDLRVETYGQVDELNALIGVVAALLQDNELHERLLDIQRDLFSLGAGLADPRSPGHQGKKEKGKIDPSRVRALEDAIDKFESELPPLRKFILPGGAPAGALLHVARTVCRRAERRVVELAGNADVDPMCVEYLNRLSDFLFVLARLVNQRQGQQEIPW